MNKPAQYQTSRARSVSSTPLWEQPPVGVGVLKPWHRAGVQLLKKKEAFLSRRRSRRRELMKVNAYAANSRGIGTDEGRLGTVDCHSVFSAPYAGVRGETGLSRIEPEFGRDRADADTLTFVDVPGVDSPEFVRLWMLYNTAFVQDERRTLLEHRRIHDDPRFHFSAIRVGARTAGLLAFWELRDMVFVEHFAIEPEFRSQGIGSRVVGLLQDEADRMIVLDVEPEASSDDALRRANFYRRQGFRYCRESVVLPRYWKAKPVPSNLMVWTPNHARLTQKQMLACIRQAIYGMGAGPKSPRQPIRILSSGLPSRGGSD